MFCTIYIYECKYIYAVYIYIYAQCIYDPQPMCIQPFPARLHTECTEPSQCGWGVSDMWELWQQGLGQRLHSPWGLGRPCIQQHSRSCRRGWYYKAGQDVGTGSGLGTSSYLGVPQAGCLGMSKKQGHTSTWPLCHHHIPDLEQLTGTRRAGTEEAMP